MLTEDYFMRMINQMLAVLTKIIGLKDAGQYQEAQQIINQSLEQLLGMPSDLLKQMDDSSVMNILTTQGELVSDRLYMVANLYELEGDLLTDQNRISDANLDYLRALTIYLDIAFKGENQYSSELNYKIEQLQLKLVNQELRVDIYYRLFDYYEQLGKYNLVENQISDLLLAHEDPSEILPGLITYYEELLEKNDQELITGGISRLRVQAQLDVVNNLNAHDN
jgi:tetratricopeptide (TPR) repeat protein